MSLSWSWSWQQAWLSQTVLFSCWQHTCISNGRVQFRFPAYAMLLISGFELYSTNTGDSNILKEQPWKSSICGTQTYWNNLAARQPRRRKHPRQIFLCLHHNILLLCRILKMVRIFIIKIVIPVLCISRATQWGDWLPNFRLSLRDFRVLLLTNTLTLRNED